MWNDIHILTINNGSVAAAKRQQGSRLAGGMVHYNLRNKSFNQRVSEMVDLMSLAEQVDKDFSVARRRAMIRRLRATFSGRAGSGVLLDFHEVRRRIGASGGFQRGRCAVRVSRIVGGAGKCGQFDERFMPLRGASAERWKRIDRALRLGVELPPVSLYRLGGGYFVQDGHHRVSVSRFHGAEWMDAEVTEFRSLKTLSAAPARNYLPSGAATT